ncbi:TnsA endonuclease N-terminal domain-containing protein [Ruminiclostridium papyrosolvens]|uniref:TnsA endonuclease N-terminal domain-containing protein n=1 Tax=Ruminiclostridium papyrosolvens C7 TaxID=1330534 RepID=U4QZ31_9FIRM|nr:TnsA endonuclease N-terminal domain-containing protein [Ruminiclostridium papyrosolvens]EPR10214.1 hypothetical protein L323_14410 [Ruminiclostridium papyrosolvens C7]
MNFDKPVDMTRATHYGNNYFEVYSRKLKRIVKLFSSLEYANFLTLEMNPFVGKFCEQPLEIEIILEDKPKKAIFDFWVLYSDKREEMQEIKYLNELNEIDEKSSRSKEQIRRQKLWCEENKISHIIRTDKDIYAGRFYIKNLEYLAAKSRRYIPLEDNFYRSLVLNTLKATKKITISDMVKFEILPIGHEMDYISYLYYEGIITMDIATRPIDGKMEVSLWQINH